MRNAECRIRNPESGIVECDAMTTLTRRSWLQASVVGPVGAAMWHTAAQATSRVERGAEVPHVKALVFDVFGTVVNWRTAVAREVEQLARRKNLTVDGAKFA